MSSKLYSQDASLDSVAECAVSGGEDDHVTTYDEVCLLRGCHLGHGRRQFRNLKLGKAVDGPQLALMTLEARADHSELFALVFLGLLPPHQRSTLEVAASMQQQVVATLMPCRKSSTATPRACMRQMHQAGGARSGSGLKRPVTKQMLQPFQADTQGGRAGSLAHFECSGLLF